jgi:hypothetical protein
MGTYHQYMPYSILLIPAFLECVYTDLACFRDIWMEDTGHHCTYLSAPHSRTVTKVALCRDIHLGGRLGYSGPNSNRTLKYPPSYGVPAVHQHRIPRYQEKTRKSSRVTILTWSLYPSFHCCQIFFIHYYPYSLWRIISYGYYFFRE